MDSLDASKKRVCFDGSSPPIRHFAVMLVRLAE